MTPKQTDWERIELDYRAGIKTLREIAGEHGVTEGAIRKRAKRDLWARDLSGKIKAKADDLVRREEVRAKRLVEDAEVRRSNKLEPTEREFVEINAQTIAEVRLSHRKDVAKTRNIVMSLLAELECESGPENADLLGQLGEMMRSPDDRGADRLNDTYQKIISLPGRAKTMKDLADSLARLVALERQAFGMDDAPAVSADDLAQATRQLLGNVVGAGGLHAGD